MISAWQKVAVAWTATASSCLSTKQNTEVKSKGRENGRRGSEVFSCVFQVYSLIHTAKRKATHVIRSKAFLRVHRQNKWQTPAPYHLISSWLRDFRQNSGSFLSIRISLISFAALCCFSLWTTETCLWPSLFPCPSWLWSIFSPTWPTTLSSQFLQS